MKDVLDVADFDTDEQILKRMEEILFTYKTKVEDKLAAEGKALPKVCFSFFLQISFVQTARKIGVC